MSDSNAKFTLILSVGLGQTLYCGWKWRQPDFYFSLLDFIALNTSHHDPLLCILCYGSLI